MTRTDGIKKAQLEMHMHSFTTNNIATALGEYRKELLEDNTLETVNAVKYLDRFVKRYWRDSVDKAYFGSEE